MPQRMCTSCRLSTDKGDLLRFVIKDGSYELDVKAIEPGRGYYLCKSEACFNKAKKKKIKFLNEDLVLSNLGL